jgi:hypothetical protein
LFLQVVAVASLPKSASVPLLQRFQPCPAGPGNRAAQAADDAKLRAAAALRALVLPRLSAANFALRGVFEAGAPDEERNAFLVPLLVSARVLTVRGPRHCLLSEGDHAGAAAVLLEGVLHVKRREVLGDESEVVDVVERKLTASGYQSEGLAEARSFVHGTNSIFAKSSALPTSELSPPGSLKEGSSVGDGTAASQAPHAIQDIVVKDSADSTGAVVGGDLLGSDQDDSKGKRYSRTVAVPDGCTARLLVFGAAEVAWAVAARHEGSVGRFLKTAARTASHTGLTALQPASVEALAVACRRRELVGLQVNLPVTPPLFLKKGATPFPLWLPWPSLFRCWASVW